MCSTAPCVRMDLFLTIFFTDIYLRIFMCDSKIRRIFKDGYIEDLNVDWITGNLYGVGDKGYMFVCNTTNSESLNCRTYISVFNFLVNLFNSLESFTPC